MLYSRWSNFVAFLICCGLLAFAAYLQVRLGLLPCPLCVLQRVFIFLLGIIFLIGSLYVPSERFGRRTYGLLMMMGSACGGLIAFRHVWLTMQPPASLSSTCSPTIEYMLQNLSFSQTLRLLLQGSGDCARESWHLLGLNIPQWTLLFFIGFFIYGFLYFVRAKNRLDV